jgi:geranylgeranyl transferase type-2 subunit beta
LIRAVFRNATASGVSFSYLQTLTLRLADGASRLPKELCEKHAQWIASQQQPDGGFAGREGESDPYYSAFALRSLWILDAVDPSVFARAASFLRTRLSTRQSIVDLISLVLAGAICELAAGEVVIDDSDLKWRENVAGLLGQLRTADGGFAKTPEGNAGSTYQTFLSVLCYELLEREPPDIPRIESFLASQRLADGGYLEIRAAKRAGVNPTAAAIGTLASLGRLVPEDHRVTAEFVSDMQSDDGGFTANTRIPFSDVLSTFTALTTLTDLEALDFVDLFAAQRYAMSMQAPGGGFYGFALDQQADVEYSFYGLGSLALCQIR